MLIPDELQAKHRRTRHHRARIIEKRKRIILDCWQSPEMFTHPGKLAKWNLSCNCWMCKGEKKAGIEKPKYRLATGGD